MEKYLRQKSPGLLSLKVKLRILLFCIIIFNGLMLIAQEREISGRITNSSKEPLAGVSVVLKGTAKGTATEKNGNFSLRALPGDTVLTVSLVGMKTQELDIKNKSQIDVVMTDEAGGLDEVIVIGYGTAQKKDLTGAVSTISGGNVRERQAVRISQSLQGAIPGVWASRTSGAPDATSTLRIRGITTIGDNNPLIIIDGIPGTLDWVNPNDVENVTVLKDAASAAIYGSRAASGVILITTKRAKSGQLDLQYDFNFGFSNPTRMPEYGDAQTYMRVQNELKWNDNNNTGSENPIYSKDLIDNYPSLHAQNPDKYPSTDWRSLIFNRHAPRQSHAISLAAGSKNFSTKVSLAYDQTQALYDQRSFDRITLRANNDFTINKFISLAVNLYGIYNINKRPVIDFGTGAVAAPIYAAEWSNGLIADGKTGENYYALWKYGGSNKTSAHTTGGKISLDITPLSGLKITGVISPEIYNSKGKYFTKQLPYTSYTDPNNEIGFIRGAEKTSLNESRNETISLTSQILTTYNKSIGNHNLNLLAGYENFYFYNESIGASRDQYTLTSFPYLDLGNSNFQYNTGNAYENAYRSYFGRILYNFNQKYYLQVNARRDGSSRFYEKVRWAFFPSVSAGWVISEENFMKDNSVLSYLKLRGSWGRLGNERIGNYPYQSTIGFGSALFYQGNNVVSQQTAAITKYAIRDISWETTESYDIGIDAVFFNNRLKFTADYYKKNTSDMLLALEIPDYIGLDNPNQNTGKMHTKGWELDLGWNDKIGNLGYSISANLSDSRSVMGDLGGTEFTGSQVKFEGSEFNEWYGYQSQGLYQTTEEVKNSPVLSGQVKPGDIRYRDISGPQGIPDGKISPEYDRVLLGGSLPRYLYGGSIRLDYKNFDFLVIIQGIGQQNTNVTQTMAKHFIEDWKEVPQLVVGDYWSKYNTPEQNSKVRYPRASTIGNTNNWSFSDYWLFNGSYFRLKNITLGYNIPAKILNNAKIHNARIFCSVTDLFSVDKFPTGWDPEGNTDFITTNYVFGLSVKF